MSALIPPNKGLSPIPIQQLKSEQMYPFGATTSTTPPRRVQTETVRPARSEVQDVTEPIRTENISKLETENPKDTHKSPALGDGRQDTAESSTKLKVAKATKTGGQNDNGTDTRPIAMPKPSEGVLVVPHMSNVFTFRAGRPLARTPRDVKQSPLNRELKFDLSSKCASDTIGPTEWKGSHAPLEDTTLPLRTRHKTPDRLIKSDRSQSESAVETITHAYHSPNDSQSSTPTSRTMVRQHSTLSTAADTSLPRRKLRSWRVEEGSDNARVCHSVSPTRLNIPLGYRDIPAPRSRSEDSLLNTSPASEHVSSSDFDDDDSLRRALMPSSPTSHANRSSAPSALIRRPTLGGLDVIWTWAPGSRWDKMPQTESWILAEIGCRLTPTELDYGHVYAFQAVDPQSRGYVKIGFTKTLKSRKTEHVKCYDKCVFLWPPPRTLPKPVLHAARVEKMVHAELVEGAMLLQRCPRRRLKHESHGEWFDVPLHHALAVIRKWTDWIMTKPYSRLEDRRAAQRPKPKTREKSADDWPGEGPWGLDTSRMDVVAKMCLPLVLSPKEI